MCNTSNNIYGGKLFSGLISSSFSMEYSVCFKELIGNFLEGNGALIYAYDRKENKPSFDQFKKSLKLGVERGLKDNQIVIYCAEDCFLTGDVIDTNKIIACLEKEIDNFKKNGFEKIVLYTTRDSFYMSRMTVEELYELHKKFKKITREKSITIIIRYIIDDFEENDFLDLISLHDTFILEGPMGCNSYSYVELIKTALINLSKKSKQEEFEKELKRIEKLKTLGELSEGISHDINNMLTTIIGFTQISLLKETRDEIKEYLNVIYRTALDGKAFADKFQSFVKGTNNPKKSIHKISDIAKGSIDMIRHRIKNDMENNDINIELVEKLNSNSCVYCNEYELRQLILNLLINALDSMKSNGVLTVRTYDKGQNVFLEVEDTGEGIDEENKKKIFEPFFTTKKAKGTGLGLCIAKKVLEEHSARIDVESKLGIGTKFTITFSKDAKDQIYAEESMNKYSYIAGKILVVDDNFVVGKSIAELVTFLNMESSVETNPERVLERLSEDEYDVVICDYSMPKMNGIEVSKMVKRIYPQKPFILLTGWAMELDNEAAKTIDCLLQKPCTIEELSKSIRKVLNYVDREKDKSYNIG
mgnify:FL=1